MQQRDSAGPSTDIDVEAHLGALPLSARHVVIVALLLAAMVIDGYDIFMVAFILPVLAEGLDVAPAALTRLLVLQQLGLLIGTIAVGPLADRFGRRRCLLIAMLLFALCTVATTQVRTLGQLEAMRFTAALFFSAVIPTTVSLAVEFAPRRYRATFVTIVFCGYAGGNLLGASVQAWILPMGWQAAFLLGGLLPLLLLPFLWLWVPESIQFRAQRDPRDPAIGRTLAWLDPAGGCFAHDRYVVTQASGGRSSATSPAALFRDGRLGPTLLLWIAFLAACIFTYIASSWGTTLLHVTRAMPMGEIARLMAASAVAGIVGTASSGVFIDRWGAARVLPAYLLGAAAAIVLIARIDLSSAGAPFAFAAMGFFSNSGWGGLNAVSSGLYPPAMRATGVAWAVGAGKVGAMIGPVIGGLLIARHWDLTPIYLLAAIPELIAAAAIFLLLRRQGQRPDVAS
jgi:AAHS family 4-hydroxybenzoate transporter-like MFS transporter